MNNTRMKHLKIEFDFVVQVMTEFACGRGVDRDTAKEIALNWIFTVIGAARAEDHRKRKRKPKRKQARKVSE